MKFVTRFLFVVYGIILVFDIQDDSRFCAITTTTTTTSTVVEAFSTKSTSIRPNASRSYSRMTPNPILFLQKSENEKSKNSITTTKITVDTIKNQNPPIQRHLQRLVFSFGTAISIMLGTGISDLSSDILPASTMMPTPKK